MPRPGLTTERVIQVGADLADEHGFDAVPLSVPDAPGGGGSELSSR